MSLKLFLLVAVLTVAATQAAQPRFRGGISTGSGSGSPCKKYNPPTRMRKNANKAFFKQNCESVAECKFTDVPPQQIDWFCGKAAAATPAKPAQVVAKVEATPEECLLANAGEGATSAEAQQMCGSLIGFGCSYFHKNGIRFCHDKNIKGTAKIMVAYDNNKSKFPKPDPAFPTPDPAKPDVLPVTTCDGKCCSNPETIDADMEGSQLGGGKCKVIAKKCMQTDVTTKPCPSQIPSGTKCVPAPMCPPAQKK